MFMTMAITLLRNFLDTLFLFERNNRYQTVADAYQNTFHVISSITIRPIQRLWRSREISDLDIR